jgi:hypothetical protein
MHPVLASRERFLIYLAAWAPVAAMIAGLTVLYAGLTWPQALALTVPLAVVYAFICLAAFYPCQVAPVGRQPLSRVLSVQAVAVAFSLLLWLFLASTWVALLEQVPALAPLGERFPQVVPVLLAAAALLWVVSAALHYLYIAVSAASRAERQALALEVLAREAELRALRAQVDPHFLFNALNSIAALTTGDGPRAREMCLSLAELLREGLRLGGEAWIPLERELAIADRYLAIEQVRFGTRLRVERRIDPAGAAWPVPPLILQPLVENAVTRGIAGLVDGGTVAMTVKTDAGRLRLEVSNPYDDAAGESGEGVGLANVRARLAAAYGKQASMSARGEGGQYRVVLALPARPEAG